MIDLSILILAKNEADNLSLLLPSINSILQENGINFETVIVIPDNEKPPANENTGKIKYITENGKGYGNALKLGFSECSGRYILTIDADLSHPPNYIRKIWKERGSSDLLVCSRYINGGKANMPIIRKMASRVLNVFFCRTLLLPLKDISSGYRLYERKSISGIQLSSRNFDILIEIAIKMYSKGLKIMEIPFEYQPREKGSSKARLFLFAISYLKTYFRMFFLRYFNHN